MHDSIQVGTELIVVKGDEKPCKDKVGRLTKTKFVLQSDLDKDKDKQAKWQVSGWSPTGIRPVFEVCTVGTWDNRKSWRAYIYSEENWTRVHFQYEEQVKAKEEKQKADEEKRQQRQQQADQQMAKTKEAVGGLVGLLLRQRCKDEMPDGTRMYFIDIPVHPEHEERKKGWERIWVRCHDTEEPDWLSYRTDGEERTVRKVECSYTYTNGNCSSFASVSTSRHSNDLEAIWACVDSRYHSW